MSTYKIEKSKKFFFAGADQTKKPAGEGGRGAVAGGW